MLDVFLVFFYRVVDIYFLSEEVGSNFLRFGGEFLIKCVGKVVGGVCGKDKGFCVGLSSL